MLPHFAGDDGERGQEGRPSLPSIRDLFGEHLAQPIKSPLFILSSPRSSPFSLSDLGSSLPVDSRPVSPTDSQGSFSSGLASPPSAWSHVSGYSGSAHAWRGSHSSRRHSAGPLLTTPSTPSIQDQLITLPPIQQSYAYSHRREDSSSSSYIMRTDLPSRRAFESHGRSRSSPEAVVTKEARASQAALEASFRRRHTIGSSLGPSPMRFRYPTAQPNTRTSSRHLIPQNALRTTVTNPYPAPSTHPSLPRSLALVVDSSPVHASPPSPPSPPTTSGDEAPMERKKTVAKYECQYCGKRFNRPSSLKIHHNTHTGEKPFACPFAGCGRHFSVMSNMRRHARIHGELSSQKPLEGSTEDTLDRAASHSSSSSSHNTPIIFQTTMPSTYSRSNPSSASPSPHLHAMSHLPVPSRPESHRRHSIVARTHPYGRSQSLSSEEGGSPSER